MERIYKTGTSNKPEHRCREKFKIQAPFMLMLIIAAFILLPVKVDAGTIETKHNSSSSNNFSEKTIITTSNGSGIGSLYRIEDNTYMVDEGHYEQRSHSKTVTATGTGSSWETFRYNGSSWVRIASDTTNQPTISYNQDGYSGTLTKTSWRQTGQSGSPPSNPKEGDTYTVTKSYEATYSGTVTKTWQEWVSNWVRHGTFDAFYRALVTSAAEKFQVLAESPNCQNVGEPVNIVTGNYYSTDLDFTLSGRGLPIQILRYYNSLDTSTGILGKGWRLGYDSNLTVNTSTGEVTVSYPDGRRIIYKPVTGTNTYTAPKAILDKLTKNADGTYKLELQDNNVYLYNTSGKLAGIADPNGNTITFTYNAAGELTKITEAGGRSVNLTYQSGRLSAITDDTGRSVAYHYTNGLLTSVENVSGTTYYTYNSYGITSIKDKNGKTFINNVYDEYGRVIRQTDEYNNVTLYTYNEAEMENTYTVVSTGYRVRYKYNTDMYITRETYDDGTYIEYTYDTAGNRKTVRNRNGNIYTYNYDERGNVLSVISPAPFNYTSSFEYDNYDNLTRVITPEGAQTEFEYDANRNLKKIKTKIDDTTWAETSYTYDTYGRVLTITDAENHTTTYQYSDNTVSQPTKIIDSNGNEISLTYDALGRLKTITTAYGTTTYAYNAQDKIIKITDPGQNITRMKYDAMGNLIKLIKPEQYDIASDDGTGYTFQYDSMDRLVKTIDPLGNVSAVKYDADGNKIKEINPNFYSQATGDGTGIVYEYDKTGRLIRIVNPSGQKSRIFYDGAGNIIKTIDANNYNEITDSGSATEYTYDQLDRLIQVKDPSGNVTARYVYNKDGQIIKAIDAKGCASGSNDAERYGTLFRYNLAGWLLEKRTPLKDENGQILYNVIQYTYDKTGRILTEKKSSEYVTETSLPAEWNIIQYTYDNTGNVIRITDSTGAEIEYLYDALGNTIQEKAKINDTTYRITGYHYDENGRLDKQWAQIDSQDLSGGYSINPATGKVHAETSYEYDRNGNLIAVTSPEGYTTTYEYDAANRLVKVNQEVSADQMESKRNTVSVTSDKKTVYPNIQYQYGVQVNAQAEMSSISIQINYDARTFELINAVPAIEGMTADTETTGKIILTANEEVMSQYGADGNAPTGLINLATLEFRAKDGVRGIGYVTIDPISRYTDTDPDTEGQPQTFTILYGKANLLNHPDMNNSSTVNTDDFTLTALLKGKASGDMAFEDKYDITGNGLIDTHDLDYIKDWLFAQPDNELTELEIQKFIQSTTNATYKSTTGYAIRTTTYEYDRTGNVVKETDCNGNFITYTYDAYNRLVLLTDKEGNQFKIEYDETGNVTKEVKPENYNMASGDGVGTVYTYDASGRLIQVTDELGNVAEKRIYNSYGELIKVIDAAGYQSASNDAARYGIEYTYDIGGRVTSIVTPQAKANAKTSVSYTYDSFGNVITQTDGEGNTTTYHRDLWGKVIRVTDANNVNTFYTYDYAGNITSTTDGNGNTTSYEYNSMNLLSRMTDPMNQEARYFYDLQGRLVKEADRNGQEVAYEYNSDNRLTLKYADETLYNKYLYNLDGTLLAAITPETVDQFSYTPNGNLYQKIHNGELELEYAYNRNGSITSVKAKSRMETRYTYDITGRLKTVHDGQTQIAQYSYNPDSTISQILYNTGANVTYQYDRDKNITGMINRNQQGNIISSYAYTYDNNGNQKSKTENGETTYYTYDDLNRLSSVQYPTAGTESYTYDNVGNRLTKTNYNAAGGVPTVNIAVSYTYDSLNRMTESLTDDILMVYKGRTAYEYDSNGSLLSETATQLDYATGQILATDPATGLPIQPQVKIYSYNAFKQNISVTNADGSFQQNIYDALGLRISTIENGYRSDYIFDRGSIIAELDGSGTLTSMNIRGYGLLAQKDGKDRLNYYLHNAHGDVTSLIDASGKVLNSYTYDAFGSTMTYAETVANRFRYAGEQFDTITGQYYLRARYYDPTVGRFTQEDTYRGDGLNLYAYVGNNPVRYVDPSGHKCEGSIDSYQPVGIIKLIDTVIEKYETFVEKTQNYELYKFFDLTGFYWDEKGIYHAKQDCWQSLFGYNNLYDIAFSIGTSMDKANFQFSCDNEDYKIWVWKGDYLNLGAGAELGIYRRMEVLGVPTDHWLVDKSLAMPMTLTLDYNGEPIISYDPVRDDPKGQDTDKWWVTGFNPAYQDVQASDLTATYTIDFSGKKDMFEAFYNTDARESGWIFDIDNYKATYSF